MSTQQIPTVAQLQAARKVLWHQEAAAGVPAAAVAVDVAEANEVDGMAASAAAVMEPEMVEGAEDPAGDVGDDAAEDSDDVSGSEVEVSPAVVTVEGARAMVERAGLMAFAPHPALAGAPGPSLVEATLGRSVSAPTFAEAEVARGLLARMVADGSAVGLNLLGAAGTTGEAPDFVVSAAAFSYVFTLRGDKGWKQLPETTGANKVSPLAVNTYGVLVESGPQTAYALTGELGKGLTEAAVTRALGELWQLLRVIPVPQGRGRPTVWEPVTTRLTRQVKAGANAGQPTALSALISLYLGQALLATEDEIETFLSTVAPRSRVRDVVHALMAAGELETMAVAGRQHLYLPGELPEFGAGEEAAEAPPSRAREGAGPRLEEDGPRMRRMVKGAGAGADRAKPFRADRGGAGKGFGAGSPAFRREGGAGPARGGFGPRPGGGAGREGGERPPRFDRPWEDGKRPPRAGGFGRDADGPRGPREGFAGKPGVGGRPGRPGGDAGRPFGGDRPAFGRPRPGGGASFAGGPRGDRPFVPRERGEGGGAGGGERRPFQREGGEGGGEFRGPRPGGDRAGGAPRAGARFGAGDRGPRPAFGAGGRSDAGEGGGRPPFRRFDAPREGGRPPFRPEGRGAGPRAPREGGDRPAGRGFGPRAGGDRPAKGFGARPFGARSSEGGERPFRPVGDGGGRRCRPAGGGGGARFGGGARPGGEGAKRPFARREGAGGRGDAPGAGPFDKFKDGKKPWGKRPPARKIKPEGEEG